MASRVKIFPIARPGDDKSVNFPYSDLASKKATAEADKSARAVRGAQIPPPAVKNIPDEIRNVLPSPAIRPVASAEPPRNSGTAGRIILAAGGLFLLCRILSGQPPSNGSRVRMTEAD